MPITDTPLRYPGGKSQTIPFVIELLRTNDLFYGDYAEPFAGGAGVALSLLFDGYMDRIFLNDLDPAIYAFWRVATTRTSELCDLIENVDINIENWHEQRRILAKGKRAGQIALAFATLFLNRTNRSGIIKGGVIGGMQQAGAYKLDCRFNRKDLVRKIQRIGAYADQIKVSNLDAIDFLERVVPRTSERTLVNLDPPYFSKGRDLYTNFYSADDHALLASAVTRISRKWMVTYDDASEIRDLYSAVPVYVSALNYSAQVKRVGTEIIALDPRLTPPSSLEGSEANRAALKAA